LTKIGQNEPGALDKSAVFHLTAVEAEGDSSGTVLAAGDADSTCASGEVCYEADTTTVGTAASKTMGVVASKVSYIAMKQSEGSTSISTKLNSGIAANAAIVEFTVPPTSNTLTNGSALKFILSTTTFALEKSSTITGYTATIERIGGSNTPISANVTGTTPTFPVNGTTNSDYQFNPGETVYLLVKLTPTFTATIAGDTSIKLNLGTTTGQSWLDRADATAKTAFRIPGVTTINGYTISN
jgi:hypothetical protein